MNYEKLKSAVARSGLKRNYIAQKIGISDAVLSDKMNGRSQWKVSEAAAFCSALGLSRKQREEIFFDHE